MVKYVLRSSNESDSPMIAKVHSYTRLILVTIALASLLGPGSAPSSAAESSCGTDDNMNYFIGVAKDAAKPLRGARADIQVFKPALCGTSRNLTSSTWAMVAEAGVTSAQGYAQIGYLRKNFGSVGFRYFWQWTRDGSSRYTSYFGDPPEGVSLQFEVTRDSSTGHLHMLRSTQQGPCNTDNVCAETDFDPLTAWNDAEAQFYSEPHEKENDIAGTGCCHVDWTEVQVKNENNSWVSMEWSRWRGGDYWGKCYWHLNRVDTSTHFKTWTEPTSHVC